VAGSVALFAGAEEAVALRLGLAMTALQLAIGAVNDLADAERDAAAGRRKPIPLGLVGRNAAAALALGGALAGLVLAASVGPLVAGLAAAGLGVGLAYDLRLRALDLGWLAFVLGLPLLLVFGWIGGAGTLAGPVLLLAIAAAPAGFGLAVANARRDVASDRATGGSSVALRLGAAAGPVTALAYGVALAFALAGLAIWGGAGVGLGLVGAGIAVLVVGLFLPAGSRGWEVQAVGLAVVALGWLTALRESGAV
jgi:4-hydroxybenzoate polyprenyltransferase